METVLTRPVVIALALTGAALSVLALFLRKRMKTENLARQLDAASYAFMGISMLLFVVAGFRGEA